MGDLRFGMGNYSGPESSQALVTKSHEKSHRIYHELPGAAEPQPKEFLNHESHEIHETKRKFYRE
jgi:hypothetical protein